MYRILLVRRVNKTWWKPQRGKEWSRGWETSGKERSEKYQFNSTLGTFVSSGIWVQLTHDPLWLAPPALHPPQSPKSQELINVSYLTVTVGVWTVRDPHEKAAQTKGKSAVFYSLCEKTNCADLLSSEHQNQSGPSSSIHTEEVRVSQVGRDLKLLVMHPAEFIYTSVFPAAHHDPFLLQPSTALPYLCLFRASCSFIHTSWRKTCF